jgi:hypothetical protein
MPSESRDHLEFRATGGDCAGFLLTRLLATVLTCGIYGFWLASDWKRWLASKTYVHGQPLHYSAGFADFVLSQVVKGALVFFTCGLYLPWAQVKGQRYDWRHITAADGRTCRFDGDGFGFIGTAIGAAALTLLTCGFGSAWGYAMKVRWGWSHTLIGGERVRFEGRVGDFLVRAIVGHFLSMLTCGIYLPWHIVNLQRWRIENASVVQGADDTPTPSDPIERIIEQRAKDPKTWIALGGVFGAMVLLVLLLGALQRAAQITGSLWDRFEAGGGVSSHQVDPVDDIDLGGDTPDYAALERQAAASAAALSPTDKVKAGKLLQGHELMNLGCEDLWALRNWVYARHGYDFTTSRAKSYFSAFSDYHRNPRCTKDTVSRYLGGADTANRDSLLSMERAKGCQ